MSKVIVSVVLLALLLTQTVQGGLVVIKKDTSTVALIWDKAKSGVMLISDIKKQRLEKQVNTVPKVKNTGVVYKKPITTTKSVVSNDYKNISYNYNSISDYKKKIVDVANLYIRDTGKKLVCYIGGSIVDLPAIMYGIAKNETSSLAPNTLGARANNPGNLHPSKSSKSYKKWDGALAGTSEIVRRYSSVQDGRYDLAYHIDYNYDCNVWRNEVKAYLLWYNAPNTPHNVDRVNKYLGRLKNFTFDFYK